MSPMSQTSPGWGSMLPPPTFDGSGSHDWLIPGGGGRTLPGGDWSQGATIGAQPHFTPYTAQNPAPWAARNPDLWQQFLASGTVTPGVAGPPSMPPAPGTDPMQPIGGPTGPPRQGSLQPGDTLPTAPTTGSGAAAISPGFWSALHEHVTSATEIDRDFLARLIRYLSGGAIPEPDQKRRPLTPPRPRALAREDR